MTYSSKIRKGDPRGGTKDLISASGFNMSVPKDMLMKMQGKVTSCRVSCIVFFIDVSEFRNLFNCCHKLISVRSWSFSC